MQDNKPILIIGLGNPGAKYNNTRHNVGFMAADKLAGTGATWKTEKKALVCHQNKNGQKVIIAKPQDFMNNSGQSVQGLMSFYKIPIENLIVMHDDMDIKIGKTKDKIGGGSAGHNGIKSIDKHIGIDYFRLRIGVGHPKDTSIQINPADWVLGKFTPQELLEINQVIDTIKIFD